MPKTELTFLRNVRLAQEWYPLPNGSQWVVITGTIQENADKTYVKTVVWLDTNRILRQHSFNALSTMDYRNDTRLENGNRVLVYRTPHGFEAYDIVNDTVTARP